MLYPNLQYTEHGSSFCGEAQMYVAYCCLVRLKTLTVCEVWFNCYVASSNEEEVDNGYASIYFSPEQDINQDWIELSF